MRLASYRAALLHVIVTRCVQRLHRMQHDGGAVVTAKGRRYLSIPSQPSGISMRVAVPMLRGYENELALTLLVVPLVYRSPAISR